MRPVAAGVKMEAHDGPLKGSPPRVQRAPQREWSNMDLGGTNVAAASVLHGPRRAVYAG
jgi:hypothetical protein